jgi:hypothetical protein
MTSKTAVVSPAVEHDKLAAVFRQHDLGCAALLAFLILPLPQP